ncbi:hypothetical protein [Streptomyces sp. NBC_00140]|nr:hypothetical protein [Streptomyces sp. NBC_00140]MCX5330834.1 hypothetical protein [Streptomyces sp. NBC_00140]
MGVGVELDAVPLSDDVPLEVDVPSPDFEDDEESATDAPFGELP